MRTPGPSEDSHPLATEIVSERSSGLRPKPISIQLDEWQGDHMENQEEQKQNNSKMQSVRNIKDILNT